MTDRVRGARAPVAESGSGRAFPRDVLAGDTLRAARALLGALLVRDGPAGEPRRVGRIVEVEAYVGVEDRASHARMGPTPRNRVMFGPPGIAYVYLVYGMHHCLNVVTESSPRPAAVLIRAVEPLAGVEAMRAARATEPTRRAGGATRRHVADARLAAGPGLVAAAFGIDRTQTGLDLCDPASLLRLEMAPVVTPGVAHGSAPGVAPGPAPVIFATPRIGIASAGEPWTGVPWRFLLNDSPSISRRV